jgi:predicted outer membrane repeat protein
MSPKTLTISGCWFFANQAQDLGGALHVSEFDVNVSTTLFQDNHVVAAASQGGAVYIGTATNFINCTFRENSAAGRGGAFFQSSGSGLATTDNCYFLNNSAVINGGALIPGSNQASLSGNGLFFCGNTVNGVVNDFSCVANLGTTLNLLLAQGSGFACGLSGNAGTCSVNVGSTVGCASAAAVVGSTCLSLPVVTPADLLGPGLPTLVLSGAVAVTTQNFVGQMTISPGSSMSVDSTATVFVSGTVTIQPGVSMVVSSTLPPGTRIVLLSSATAVQGQFSAVTSSDPNCPPPQVMYTGLSVVLTTTSCAAGTTSPAGLSTAAIVGIAVGASVGVVLLVVALSILGRHLVGKRDVEANMAIKKQELKDMGQ